MMVNFKKYMGRKKVRSRFLLKGKRGMSLSILFLVLATLILMGSSLIIFSIRANEFSVENSFVNIEEVYIEAELTEFYIPDIMKKSVISLNPLTEQVFINNFRGYIDLYEERVPFSLDFDLNFENLRPQITKDNIEIRDGKVFLTLNIQVNREINREEGSVSVSYSYTKTFVQEIREGPY